MGKFIDLTNQKFGKLTIVERVANQKNQTMWKCLCECGNMVVVSSNHLKSGHTKSCGCLCDSCLDKHYNFKGNIWRLGIAEAIGYDSKGNEFVVDLDDYPLLKQYCWSACYNRRTTKGNYFCARMSRVNGHQMKMLHSFIWELHYGEIPNKMILDHKDQNPNNNKLSNLRLVDKSFNGFNSPKRNNNTSGVTGVSYCNGKCHHGKWRAYINVQKKRIELGYFNTKEEAIKVRENAELKYYGELLCQKE